MLERLSKQPSERATPDSGRGRNGPNSNWSENDYHPRNLGDGWDGNKGLHDQPEYPKNNRNYDNSSFLESPIPRSGAKFLAILRVFNFINL